MNMFERYSIWALPEESTERELKDIILFLNKLYGGPSFEPHLTLLGDVKADQKQLACVVDKLAEELTDFNLKLGEVSFSTTFFQSVFIHVLATTKLMEQNLKAKQLLGLENNLFMPHVSLLYGDQDIKTREQASRQVILSNNIYNVNRLALVPSKCDPQDWVILHQAKILSK